MPVVDLSKPLGDPEQVRDHTAEELAAIAADLAAEPPPAPVEQRVAAGYATVTGAAVSSVDGFGFGSATRVALGAPLLLRPIRSPTPAISPRSPSATPPT
jgi:hypothetical protein